MSYLKNFTVATSGVGDTRTNVIMGDIPSLEQYTSQVPTFRIACLGCPGDEPIAMGVWTVIRYALERFEDIRTYPAYFDVDNPSQLQMGTGEFQYFPEIKNNVTLHGSLSVGEGIQLTLTMSGILVNQARQVIIANGSDLNDFVQKLPGVLDTIIAQLVERHSEQKIVLHVNSHEAAIFGDIWHLEKSLIESLINDEWDDLEFVASLQAAIGESNDSESDMITETRFDIARSAVFPPYVLDGTSRKRLIDTIFESNDEVAVASLIVTLNKYNASQTAIQLFVQSNREFGNLVSGRLAESYLLSGNLAGAIELYQNLIGDHHNVDALAAYASTLVHTTKVDQLPENFLPILVTTDHSEYVIEEILAAFRKAFETEGEAQHLVAAFDIAIEYDHHEAHDLFILLAESDFVGTHVASGVALLQEDELSALVESMEAHTETAQNESAILFLTLAEMYWALDDYDAAAECLGEYLALSIESNARVRLLQLRIQFPQLEFQVSEFQQMNEQKKVLSDSDIDILEGALIEYSWYIDGYVVLANAYANRADIEAGLEVLQDAMKIVVHDTRLYLTLANLYWRDGQHALALETCLNAVQQFPHDVSLIVWLARALFDDGAEDEARLYLRQAEMIAPTSRELATIRGYIGSKLNSD